MDTYQSDLTHVSDTPPPEGDHDFFVIIIKNLSTMNGWIRHVVRDSLYYDNYYNSS